MIHVGAPQTGVGNGRARPVQRLETCLLGHQRAQGVVPPHFRSMLLIDKLNICQGGGVGKTSTLNAFAMPARLLCLPAYPHAHCQDRHCVRAPNTTQSCVQHC